MPCYYVNTFYKVHSKATVEAKNPQEAKQKYLNGDIITEYEVGISAFEFDDDPVDATTKYAKSVEKKTKED